MTYILIYIAGFIASFYIWKLIHESNDWEGVGSRLYLSIFSWVSVVFGIVVLIVFLIQKFFQNNKIFKNEPPKWL
jgi:Na+/proline symporter